MFLLAKKGKPLKRVPNKATTNRRATVEDYGDEIEELYRYTPTRMRTLDPFALLLIKPAFLRGVTRSRTD
jgi:hypothetical protein